MTRILGMDTSHWDGKVNAKKAKEKGIKFCYFKMTDFYSSPAYPTGWIDDQAVNTWNATRDEGMINGGFCWLQPKQDPVVQAKFYLDAYTKYPTDMPPILDFEKQAVNSWNDFLWRAQVWLTYVEEQTKELPWVYTNQDLMNQMDRSKSAFLYRYPLIVASYRPTYLKPAMPQPWDKWVMWQYTKKAFGFDYGVPTKELDLDIFEGTEQDLRALLGSVIPPEPLSLQEQVDDLKVRVTRLEESNG